jgi:hypothetical protein
MLRGGWSLWATRALIQMKWSPIEFEIALASFREYLKQGSKAPNFWTAPKETRASSCPFVLQCLRDLRPQFTIAQIMEMPVTEAHWHLNGPVEKAGAIEFIDDDVIAEAKAMAKQVAEEEAAKNGVC